MDWSAAPLLFAAGIAGGLINALAGGATLITFPAMLASGLPPVTANASNAVAISPGHLVAIFADIEKLPAPGRNLVISIAICTIGGGIGGLILLALPNHVFMQPVPALIAFATALFAAAPRISRWAERRRNGAEPRRASAYAMLAVSSVYGGFFGAGLGVILTAVLSLIDPDDIRRVKVLKNLLATCVTLAAIVIFLLGGAIAWPQTCVMLAGALLGGYAGGHLIRTLPAKAVRNFVIVAGAIMSIVYAIRIWL